MLSDAELLLGLGRHLAAYTISTAHAALEALQFAGQVYEMAWRLRNSQVSTAGRIQAIGVEAHIGSRILDRDVLPTMEQMGWVECRRDPDGVLISLEALIPPNDQLVDDAGRLLDVLLATPVQRAALELIRATSRQPLTVTSAVEIASVHGEEAAEQALRHLVAIGLVRRIELEVDRPVVFNPNIWTSDPALSKAALRAEDARANTEVGALIDEVAALPGLPEKHVQSTEKKWVDFAVSQGLVERSLVQTSTGEEEGFLFAPHLKRDAFGVGSADPSGHVRQMVGSMIYATTFATTYRLRSPGAFLYALIRNGEAGNVPNIATDYAMLELAGTIKVETGSWGKAARMVLLQTDVAETALDIIDSRGRSRGAVGSLQALGEQRAYSHIERERARMATATETHDEDQARLIAALRDATSGGVFGA
ncbi:hypothetical protein [Kineococcus aurantiacus]|uniref:Uncharacterized protein n=1 Tax=Kineococcus aurantiacus TaxID=37633 RepID=A0A7Y9J3J0_9ACTN|nr:hypothetical protein [Kineococcus aurantiacus]NYD25043.1 hypothetical protein [Kineococcus aurantiacus]